MDQRLDEAREITKQIGVESASRAIARRGRGEVGPFKGNGEAAAFGITQDECVDTSDAARLQYAKALTSTRVEGMRDLRPTQKVVGPMCS